MKILDSQLKKIISYDDLKYLVFGILMYGLLVLSRFTTIKFFRIVMIWHFMVWCNILWHGIVCSYYVITSLVWYCIIWFVGIIETYCHSKFWTPGLINGCKNNCWFKSYREERPTFIAIKILLIFITLTRLCHIHK